MITEEIASQTALTLFFMPCQIAWAWVATSVHRATSQSQTGLMTALYMSVKADAISVQIGWITLVHSQVKTSPRTLIATCIGVRTTPTMTANAICAAVTIPSQTALMTPIAVWNAVTISSQAAVRGSTT